MKRFLTLLAFLVGFVLAVGRGRSLQAADCCRLTVTGCGKSANVCVAQSCNLDTQARAKKTFASAYKCESANVSSYIGTCSGEKCDLDLR